MKKYFAVLVAFLLCSYLAVPLRRPPHRRPRLRRPTFLRMSLNLRNPLLHRPSLLLPPLRNLRRLSLLLCILRLLLPRFPQNPPLRIRNRSFGCPMERSIIPQNPAIPSPALKPSKAVRLGKQRLPESPGAANAVFNPHSSRMFCRQIAILKKKQ